MHKYLGLLSILIVVIILLLIWRYYFSSKVETIENPQPSTLDNFRVFVINLDKDVNRYDKIVKYYQRSDLSTKPLNRYPAVIGKNENPAKWLSTDAIAEFNSVVNNGFRTHHHQLTYGGIGCFLSHYNLAKQLLVESSDIDTYLVFEDDTSIPANVLSSIQEYMKSAPADWDYVMLYTIRQVSNRENNKFNKLKSFWGMNGYFINKRGAQKFIDEVDEKKIDGQIDSYLSRMIQQNKLNIYATANNIVKPNSSDTNIQIKLNTPVGVNPYNFKGYII